jgi:short-subunit dehydrogenase
MRDPRVILITGASSGIGESLARHYARPGVLIALSGRDVARLETVAEHCRSAGAQSRTATLDVVDAAAVANWIGAIDDERPLDLVIANAGISAGTGAPEARDGLVEPEAQTRAIFATNVDGVLNTVLPALRRMLARGRGQIALMSSLASFRGLPGTPTYCASKALVRTWAEGLRPDYARLGVEINVICPGYVRSAMTDRNDFRMPLLMSAERAAAIIARGLAANRARIVFPWRMYWALRAVGALPEALLDRILPRLPRKRPGTARLTEGTS